MYESYSRQALPSKRYRELLGSALCVFNSNNNFVIENILRIDEGLHYSWYNLIDRNSGELSLPIKEIISKTAGTKIAYSFDKLISKRNRIVHSFQITDAGEQKLASKNKKNQQFVITEDYLIAFIRDNESLSSLLHNLRGY